MKWEALVTQVFLYMSRSLFTAFPSCLSNGADTKETLVASDLEVREASLLKWAL